MSKILFVLASVASAAAVALSVTPTDVEFNITTVDDSASYYVYRYELVNPSSSTGGLISAAMDVSASSGAPQPLASTGTFRDWTGVNPPAFAEVGPDVPQGWKGTLTSSARLRWHLPTLVDSSPDSVAPGDTVSFAIRSSYLPGLRNMYYGPTVESCCLEPVDTTEERWLASPLDFEVTGLTVGPRYLPSEIDLDLLQSQLDAVCDDPLWIDDASLCSDLADSLHVAEARLAIDNYEGGVFTVKYMGNILAANRAPSGSVEDGAYWLLRTNGDYFWENYPEEIAAGATLCAKSESAGVTAYFTVTATGGILRKTSPFQMDVEQIGVDPSGSSCTGIWTIAWGDTLNVDVTTVLDSMTSGFDVERLYLSGGQYPDTTLEGSVLTAVTGHDGNDYAQILFQIEASETPEQQQMIPSEFGSKPLYPAGSSPPSGNDR